MRKRVTLGYEVYSNQSELTCAKTNKSLSYDEYDLSLNEVYTIILCSMKDIPLFEDGSRSCNLSYVLISRVRA